MYMVLKSPRSITNNKKSESGFTTILVGIILISLLFASYNIFLNKKPATGSTQEMSIVDKIKEKFGANEKVGEISDTAAMDSRDETVAGAESDRSMWVATDYQQGEIQAGSYVVKEGDTLWEIAEAVYGNGGEWHKILDANKNSVGFLPNGSQALIVTGQTLTIN
jgi:nucleoid-associated protein YgaU